MHGARPLVLPVLAVLAGACARSSAPVPAPLPDHDSGAVDAPPSSTPPPPDAGGPDCRPSIGGCYQAVNAAAYQTLGAAAIEKNYLASCSNEPGICDCAPGVPGCVAGACVMKQMFCCNCPPDAGP